MKYHSVLLFIFAYRTADKNATNPLKTECEAEDAGGLIEICDSDSDDDTICNIKSTIDLTKSRSATNAAKPFITAEVDHGNTDVTTIEIFDLDDDNMSDMQSTTDGNGNLKEINENDESLIEIISHADQMDIGTEDLSS